MSIESKIRDLIRKNLQISREISILRVKRANNGPNVRGCKPLTVYFDRWEDKDEIMRKTKFLKGSNVYVGEDFSKRVRDQRNELQKFMKAMRTRRPGSKFSLQYDKLFIDKDVFMFNDITGQVEQMHQDGGFANDGEQVRSRYSAHYGFYNHQVTCKVYSSRDADPHRY